MKKDINYELSNNKKKESYPPREIGEYDHFRDGPFFGVESEIQTDNKPLNEEYKPLFENGKRNKQISSEGNAAVENDNELMQDDV